MSSQRRPSVQTRAISFQRLRLRVNVFLKQLALSSDSFVECALVVGNPVRIRAAGDVGDRHRAHETLGGELALSTGAGARPLLATTQEDGRATARVYLTPIYSRATAIDSRTVRARREVSRL